MDSQAIGPAEKKAIHVEQKLSSEVSNVPSGGKANGQPNDTVSLSQRGQAAVTQQVQNKSGGSAASELRKIDVTDDNQVVVKILDGQTQKVVRQIPKEEEVRLRQAIQENLDVLDNASTKKENLDGII
ncbi:MAG: hypothetical protein HN474_00615 [Nitrospina sp.]|jgi:uncharacterized FlaG/YvyC family protein|nr:hypothetical protein [Nitrospina sp.]MBT4127490.1 hypothetical protein [Nitrospina sp.]